MIAEEKYYKDWVNQQNLLWQTRTLATAITSTIQPAEGEDTTPQFEWAKNIGKGVLLEDEENTNDKTPEGHVYNNFEEVMNMFGGSRMQRYG